MNARYLKLAHKFGNLGPKKVAEAIALDENSGDTRWQYAISKEMKHLIAAFKIISKGGKLPPGYQKIRFHMIFDIKMEDFRRKSRLVAGGHVTKPPAIITYSIMVSRETVCVAFSVAGLNGLQVKTADIQISYIQAPVAEKIWTVLVP